MTEDEIIREFLEARRAHISAFKWMLATAMVSLMFAAVDGYFGATLGVWIFGVVTAIALGFGAWLHITVTRIEILAVEKHGIDLETYNAQDPSAGSI